jgi:peptide/nickel transport system substrate-binding protein/microcin C transport system substrate-binding protein
MIASLLISSALFTPSAFAGLGNDHAPVGGTLVYNLDAEPATLNALSTQDVVGQWVYEMWAETLLDRDPQTYEVTPSLATKWNISKDGRVFTFTLRDDAKWHDGQPVTVEDVKFSYDIIFKNDYLTAPLRPYFDGIEKVEIVDPHTVRFTAKNTYWQNFDVVSNMLIVLPKHVYEDSKNKK